MDLKTPLVNVGINFKIYLKKLPKGSSLKLIIIGGVFYCIYNTNLKYVDEGWPPPLSAPVFTATGLFVLIFVAVIYSLQHKRKTK